MAAASRHDIQCRYFSRGCCLLGDRCPYSHGSSTSKAPRPTTTCRFYQSGKCAFGAGCDHSSETAYLQKRSIGKQCGLCSAMIWEKELRFGILNKCKHSFCLDCIRNWRSQQSKQLTRSCPECRVRSALVVPSVFWIEDENEKKLLIEMFKKNTKQTLCTYFKNKRKCPFGKRCFYMHQRAFGGDGRDFAPQKPRQPRYRILQTTGDRDTLYNAQNYSHTEGRIYNGNRSGRSQTGPGQDIPADEPNPFLELWNLITYIYGWLVYILFKLTDAIVGSIQVLSDVVEYRTYMHSDRSGPPPNLVLLDHVQAAAFNNFVIPFSLFAFFLLSCRIVFASLFSST